MPSHSPLKKSFNPFQMDCAAPVMAFQMLEKKSFRPFHTAMAASFMTFHRLIQNSRNPSQLFHKATKMAINAAMAAITKVTGFAARMPHKALSPPPILEMPPISVGMKVMMLPTAETTFPITISTGPIAAARSPMVTMVFLVPSSMPFSLSTNPCTHVTIWRMAGMRISPKEMASSSNWLFRMVSCPARLSCMVAAISADFPSQFAMALLTFSISAGAAFISARNPDMAFFPTSASAAAAFSDSDRPPKAVRQSARIALKSLMLPSALVVAMVTSPMFEPQIFTSPERLLMMVRSAVPACVDLMPALPISPIASAVSSAENPKAPAMGAQYLKVSPIMETLVFALELAAARISAKCPESAAVRPKAVSASVTISEVLARSSPEAAARFMMPSMPESISEVFQPAIAM